ncbi:P-loop NTPase fold protein [Cystobacter fuscus]
MQTKSTYKTHQNRNRDTTQRQATKERWIDVAILFAGGCGSGLLILGTIDCAALFRFGWLKFSAMVLIFLSISRQWFRLQLKPLIGVQYLRAYPPIWLPALLGAFFSIGCGLLWADALLTKSCALPDTSLSDVAQYFFLIASTSVFAWVIWIGSSHLVDLYKPHQPISTVETKQTDNNQSQFLGWLASDEAVHSIEDDLFGHAAVAKRLSEIILSDSEPTVALIGKVGAGKTSLFNMASEFLSRHKNSQYHHIHLARLSLWPFDSVQAAITGILNSISNQLNSQVSTFPLKGLPVDYVDAIEGSGWPWIKAVRLARPEQPSDILRRIDLVALAINIKVVLWVEDFERFAGLVRSATEPEYIRLAPLRALLNELAELKSVQIVLASSAADFKFDIEKLARFTIELPSLSTNTVSSSTKRLRNALSSKFPDDIDPAQETERKRFWPSETAEQLAGWTLIGGNSSMHLARAMSILCTTPRQLKQVLRRFGDAWDRLHGEIDFDDLLMISIIHSTAPSIHEAIGRNIEVLRVGARLWNKKSDSKTQFALETAALLDLMAPEASAALKYLIDELFPGWEVGEASASVSQKRPQAIASTHTDYWKRYVSLEAPSDANADQPVLKLVAQWKKSKDSALIDLLVSGGYPESLEAFLAVVADKGSLLQMLHQLIDTYLKQKLPIARNDISEPPGLVSIWRMMLQNRPGELELGLELEKHIRTALPANISIAYSLINFFATLSNEVAMLITNERAKELTDLFQHLLFTYFNGKPDELALALKGARSHTIYWGSWGLDRIRARQAHGIPGDHWHGFAQTLTEGARRHPSDLLPQILPFVVKQRDMLRRSGSSGQIEQVSTYDFDKESTEKLFHISSFFAMMDDTRSAILLDPTATVMRNAVLEFIDAHRNTIKPARRTKPKKS